MVCQQFVRSRHWLSSPGSTVAIPSVQGDETNAWNASLRPIEFSKPVLDVLHLSLKPAAILLTLSYARGSHRSISSLTPISRAYEHQLAIVRHHHRVPESSVSLYRRATGHPYPDCNQSLDFETASIQNRGFSTSWSPLANLTRPRYRMPEQTIVWPQDAMRLPHHSVSVNSILPHTGFNTPD